MANEDIDLDDMLMQNQIKENVVSAQNQSSEVKRDILLSKVAQVSQENKLSQ